MSYSTASTSSASATTSVRRSGQPLYPSEVDTTKITYTEVKAMSNGVCKTCYVNYEGGPLLIEFPWMTTYDGIALPPAEFRDDNAPPKYSIQFSMKGYQGDNPQIKALYECMQEIQNKLIQDSCKHSMQWHKKPKMSPDVAEAILSPLVKISMDKDTGEVLDQYPPKFKVKVPYWDGKFDCSVFKSGIQTPLKGDLSEQVCGRMEARAIVQCGGLWFAGSKFGMSWKLKQMEFRTIEQAGLASYAFREPTPACAGGVDEANTVQVGGGTDSADDAVDDVLEEDDEIVDSDME